MADKTYKTKEYDKFKFIKTNRKTSAGHVSKIKTSLQKKNLIQDFPILVDRNMNILDGQHRFEALKLMNEYVYYRFSNEMSVSDIKLVNSVARKWSAEEHLESYCEEGNKEYKKVKQFMSWAGINSVTATIKILLNKGSIRSDNTGARFSQTPKTIQDFKDGLFVYPEPDTTQRNFILRLKELAKYTAHKNPFERSFYVAISEIMQDENLDLDRLESKLKSYPLGVYNDANSLIDQLEKAYNYNVRDNQRTLLRRVK